MIPLFSLLTPVCVSAPTIPGLLYVGECLAEQGLLGVLEKAAYKSTLRCTR